MDLVVQNVCQREALRTLNSFLLDITDIFPTMLGDYLNFFKEKKLHITGPEYRSGILRVKTPFPGFSAVQIEAALQIAEKNDDKTTMLLLLELFLVHFDEVDRADVDAVRAAIEQGQKLNFNIKMSYSIQNIEECRPWPYKKITTARFLRNYLSTQSMLQ
jgi:hypothetical protein